MQPIAPDAVDRPVKMRDHPAQQRPAGNVGRSTVGITRRMDPPEPVQVLIDWAVLGARLPRTGW